MLHGPPGDQVVPDVDRVSRVHRSKLYEPHRRLPVCTQIVLDDPSHCRSS